MSKNPKIGWSPTGRSGESLLLRSTGEKFDARSAWLAFLDEAPEQAVVTEPDEQALVHKQLRLDQVKDVGSLTTLGVLTDIDRLLPPAA